MISEVLERNRMTFPYGVTPEVAVDEATEDARGADTLNRLLLHGARYHDRDGVFRDWTTLRDGTLAWDATPDWRADRNAVRVGLVLRQRLSVDKGDSVAMWMPFGLEWPVIERGIWSIGAISVPVRTSWTFEQIADVLQDSAPIALFAPNFRSYEQLRVLGGIPDSVQAVIVLDGTGLAEEAGNEQALAYDRFLDYGGVLDTPERASMWRTSARSIRAADPLSTEYGFGSEGMSKQSVSNEEFVLAIRSLLEKVPPQPARVQAFASEEPFIILRLLAYAGWADGLTTSAFAGTAEAREKVAQLSPSLVACSAEDLPALRAAIQSAGQASGSPHVVLLGDAPSGDGVPKSAANILDVNMAEFDSTDPGQVNAFAEDGNE